MYDTNDSHKEAQDYFTHFVCPSSIAYESVANFTGALVFSNTTKDVEDVYTQSTSLKGNKEYHAV